jgi:23S rRNA (uracil1939-C5)-methyltransferase
VGRKKNIIIENLRIEDYAAEGKSLARVDGKVIFIEHVVPGDIVDVRLTRNKKDWAEGIPVQIRSFSPERVEPFCQHFGVCGGCQWQMLPYEKQLLFKQKQVYETLKRIGKLTMPELIPILGADDTKYYRNKVEYTFGNKEFLPKKDFEQLNNDVNHAGVSENRVAVAGYHAKGIFDKVVDIQTCYLQSEPTNAIRLAVKSFSIENNFSFYDIRAHTGFLRTMQVRICTTGEILVNIVFGYDDQENREKLLNFLLQQFPQLTSLLYTINTKWNDSLNDLEPITYNGKGYILERMEDFVFKIGPKSFFQTNTRQGEKLYKITRDFSELTGNEIVYDLYCGTGSIGIFVSKNAKKIIGVEVMEDAVHDAIENSSLNQLTHTLFFKGDVIEICNNEFFTTHGKPDVIITDPPRAGMHEKLVRKILDMEAAIVVYVSCNPATQARDLNLLDEKYRVTKIQPVDMFPHTHHIENVVQLKLK